MVACSEPSAMPDPASAEERRRQAARLRANAPQPVASSSTSDDDGDSEQQSDAAHAADPESPDDSSSSPTAGKTPPTEDGDETPAPAMRRAGESGPGYLPDPKYIGQAAPDDDPLVLGEFRLRDEKPIIDGDTIAVEGLDASLRLLGIDSEETFKKEKHREMAYLDFDDYAAEMRGDSPRPVKYGTPAGEEAREWAERFFAGHDRVRLEFDELGRQRGVYGRYLVYVLIRKNGEWVNYNIEHVRAGMAPYFSKYGYSRRFHQQFVDAQAEAQAKELGIWGDDIEHYPDYDERLPWWNRRAEAIAHYEREHMDDPAYFQLGIDEEWDRMADHVGKTVTVFGTIGATYLDDSPYRVNMSHKRFQDFTVVAFDRPALDELGILEFDGEFFYVRGELSTYRGKYQFKADDVVKVWME